MFGSGKRRKYEKRFHRRKFKKITNKVIKTAKNTLIWAFII